MTLELPRGGQIPLSAVADVVDSSGPNTINRENVRRRIVVQCNTAGRDLGGVVAEIQQRLAPIQASLPTGYFIQYSGQFESQQSATRTIGLLSLVSLVCMLLTLYTLFHSFNLSLQVLAALPMAAIGAVAALVITRQSLTVASMVGFISLAGIASRNGILLIAHYLHLVRHEGEHFTPKMIERAGKERLAPMLMTALCAGHRPGPAGAGRRSAGQGNPLSGGHGHPRRADQFHAAGLLRAPGPVLDLRPQGGETGHEAASSRTGPERKRKPNPRRAFMTRRTGWALFVSIDLRRRRYCFFSRLSPEGTTVNSQG